MDLLSEEEQWERLKAWLRTNGPFIVILTAVFVLAWFGWKWWQGRNDQQALAAGVAYEKVLRTFDENKIPEALALIETLRTEFPKSPYVDAADLIAVRVHVGNNELDKAVERLERVANQATDEKLRPVARLRLARVLTAQGQFDKALATLGTESMGQHEAGRLEVRGDVLYAKDDRAGALADYEAARKLLPPDEAGANGVGELLDLKIADLRSTVASASTAASAAAPAAAPAAPAATAAPAAPATPETAK